MIVAAIHFALLAAALLAAGVAPAEPPLAAARALVASYGEEPSRLERARELLEAALRERGGAPAAQRVETLVLLARVHFLIGDLLAHDDAAKVAAFDRGRTIGRQAVELAPENDQAHLWYAINTGRFGEAKGILRALFILPIVREEVDLILRLNPVSAEAHALAGGLLRDVPRLLGGDLGKAEAHLREAVRLDPRRTGFRVELARLYVVTGRPDEARRELRRVLAEPSPSDPPYCELRDRPRAREMLAELDREP